MTVFAVVLAIAALILAVVALDRAGAANRRARTLEDELARLHSELAARPAGTKRPPEAPPAAMGATGVTLDADAAASDVASLPAPEDEGRVTADEADAPLTPRPHVEPPRGVEAAIGLTWATRVGGALLLAGVIFFFKYAVDRDWLGPWARVGLGAGTGGVAIAVAARLRGRVSKSWVDIIAGVGLAILLVVAWASHALYGLVPPIAAFAAFLALVVAGGALAVAFDSEPLLVTAALAALANPILLGDAIGDEGLRFAYVDVIAAATLAVAVRRRWALAAFGAAAGGLAVGVAWWLTRDGVVPTDMRWTALSGVAALGGVVMTAALRWENAPVRHGLLALGASIIVIAIAALMPRDADPLMAAACGGVAVGLTVARLTSDVGWANLAALLVTTAAIAVRGAPAEPAAVAVLGLVAVVYLLDAATALAHKSERATAAEHLLWQLVVSGLAFTALAIAGLGLGARATLAVAAGGMTVAYGVAGAWLLGKGQRVGASAALHVALAFLATVAPLTLHGVAVAVAWSALGALSALLAARAALPRLELGSLAALGLALAHTAVVGWPAPDFARAEFIASDGAEGAFFALHITGARTLSLIAIGIGILVFAFASRRTRWRKVGVVARFVGLAALGLALTAEAALFVDRGAVAFPVRTGAEALAAEALLGGAASLRGLATTLALGGWGAAVLTWGFVRRDVHARWFGLGLLAAVVLKVLAVDLWDFDPVARTVILVAFGVLLLASGFLYARFGERLRGLLREEEGDDE
ncbi:MAG: hypothetical protein CVU56_00375 [Deltaproteobacteria bacterium HGW-Deltaproteobacteria-14]|jgi:uncharacterized membrane protein|nr:MAG: hypothetical protein CVU56_00375 [Deltaproteobacteria bacterium HGW-Deltaproteobacteria-14]